MSVNIPKVQTPNRQVNQLQDNIRTSLAPILQNPVVMGQVLQSVPLTTGANSVNTLLNRTLQGWFIVRQRAAASVYDTQDSNATPQTTLNLVSSADVVIDLYVF